MSEFETTGGRGREPHIPGAVRCPRCGLNLHPKIEVCPACDQDMRAPYPAPGVAVPTGQHVPAGALGDPSYIPPAPREDVTPAGSVPAGSSRADLPGEVVVGIIQHDIVIGGDIAFRNGERVRIEGESPDADRPEYRFVVYSTALGKRFRLSDLDVLF